MVISDSFLIVGANGLPDYGNGVGLPDFFIGPSEVGVVYDEGGGDGVGWTASVTYTITGVPDASATWFLLGIGLASVAIVRRFFRQIHYSLRP